MLVNPFICLEEPTHDAFDQDSLVSPSFAPLTQTFHEKEKEFSKKLNIFSHILPKTTNTVIIKNLNFDCDNKKISNLLQTFGEIFSLKYFNKKGMAIATFYDTRSSEEFIRKSDGMIFEQREIKCNFIFSQNIKELLNRCPSVILKSLNENLILNKEDIFNFVSQNYGELRQVIDCGVNTFVVEFYDFRYAQKMINENKNIIISRVPFEASYAPEITKIIDQIQKEQDYQSKHDNYALNGFRF